MTHAAVALLFLVVAGAAQMALPTLPWPAETKLPCLMAVAVYEALHRPSGPAVLAACAAGWMQDALSPIPMGYSMAVFGLTAWLLGRFRGVVESESLATVALCGALANALAAGLLCVALARGGALPCSAAEALRKMAGQAAAGLVATPILGWLIGAVDRWVGSVRKPVDVFDDEWNL